MRRVAAARVYIQDIPISPICFAMTDSSMNFKLILSPRASGNLFGESTDGRILINSRRMRDLEYRAGAVNKLTRSYFSVAEGRTKVDSTTAENVEPGFSITRISRVKTTATFSQTSPCRRKN